MTNKAIAFRFDPETIATLKASAKSVDLTDSAVMRALIHHFGSLKKAERVKLLESVAPIAMMRKRGS